MHCPFIEENMPKGCFLDSQKVNNISLLPKYNLNILVTEENV